MRGSRSKLFPRLTNKTLTDVNNYADSSLLTPPLRLMSFILHNQMNYRKTAKHSRLEVLARGNRWSLHLGYSIHRSMITLSFKITAVNCINETRRLFRLSGARH